MTKRVFYDGGGADAPAYDDRYVTLKPGKKAQVNATYQPALPYPWRAQKGRHRTAHQPEGSRTADAAPPPKNARGYSSKL